MKDLFKLWDELSVPTLEAKLGVTGYFDQFKPNDLSVPIMKGIDKWERKFISLRVREEHHLHGKQTYKECVIVFFQRHSDPPGTPYNARQDVWVVAGDVCKRAMGGLGALESIEPLQTLLWGGTVLYQLSMGERLRYYVADAD